MLREVPLKVQEVLPWIDPPEGNGPCASRSSTINCRFWSSNFLFIDFSPHFSEGVWGLQIETEGRPLSSFPCFIWNSILISPLSWNGSKFFVLLKKICHFYLSFHFQIKFTDSRAFLICSALLSFVCEWKLWEKIQKKKTKWTVSLGGKPKNWMKN